MYVYVSGERVCVYVRVCVGVRMCVYVSGGASVCIRTYGGYESVCVRVSEGASVCAY